MEYFGQRVFMLRKGMFKLLADELEKRHASGTGKIILGILGRSQGHEEGTTVMSDIMLESVDGRSVSVFVKHAVEETNLGYGKLKLGDLDLSAKSVTVSTQNSVEADPPAKSEETRCFFLLGYLEGLFSELLSCEMTGQETSCRGKGDESCIFQIATGPRPSKWKL